MDVYHDPHPSRKYEKLFLNWLYSCGPVVLRPANPAFHAACLPFSVSIQNLINRIIQNLAGATPLPRQAATLMLDDLRRIQSHGATHLFVLRPGAAPGGTKFDFVIDDNGHRTFVEIDEKQHRNLTGGFRKGAIYNVWDSAGTPFSVQRRTQRLVRDFWRWTLPNIDFRVIWFDALGQLVCNQLLSPGKREWYVPGKFNFTNF